MDRKIVKASQSEGRLIFCCNTIFAFDLPFSMTLTLEKAIMILSGQ
jgi:hypothetical protein